MNTGAVSLKDMQIEGDLIIAEGVGSGNVYLSNVTVAGNIIVKGGGVNSVYLQNVSITGKLYASRANQAVRVTLTGMTAIPQVVVENDAQIITDQYFTGFVGSVNITGGKQVTVNGTFPAVESNSTGVYLSLQGTIGALRVNNETAVNGTVVAVGIFIGKDIPGMEDTTTGGGTTTPEQTTTETIVGGVKLNDSKVEMEGGQVYTATVSDGNLPANLDLDKGKFIWSAYSSDGGEVVITENADKPYEVKIIGKKVGTVTLKIQWEYTDSTNKITYMASDTMTFQVNSVSDVLPEIEDELSYRITLAEAKNGTLKVNASEADKGDTIVVTAIPDNGYSIGALYYTLEGSEDRVYIGTSTVTYTFTMPGGNVTVTAVFEER